VHFCARGQIFDWSKLKNHPKMTFELLLQESTHGVEGSSFLVKFSKYGCWQEQEVRCLQEEGWQAQGVCIFSNHLLFLF
jgi:hypothetical protein